MSLCFRHCGWTPTVLLLASSALIGSAGLAQTRPIAPGQDSFPAKPAQRSLSTAEASLLHAKRQAIAEEAAFFGYDLSQPGWTPAPAPCPEIPGYLLLHYRRVSHQGAQSVFTALVPPGRAM